MSPASLTAGVRAVSSQPEGNACRAYPHLVAHRGDAAIQSAEFVPEPPSRRRRRHDPGADLIADSDGWPRRLPPGRHEEVDVLGGAGFGRRLAGPQDGVIHE